MKKILFSLALIAVTAISFAQANGAAAPKQTVEQMAATKTQELNRILALNADQMSKVQAICSKFYQQREQYAGLKQSNMADYKAKMQPLREENGRQIKAILTPGQQVKFDQIESKKQQ